MRTRLIVLIDFNADNLLKFAGLWSEILKADLILIHQVLGLVPSLADGSSRAMIIDQEKKEGLAKLRAQVNEHIPQTQNIKYIVSEHPVQTTIQSVTEQNSNYYNIILVGLKTRGFFQQLIFGSTTSKLIDELNLPIIAIPTDSIAFVPEKLIVALSYHYPLNSVAYEEFVSAIGERVKKSELISVVTTNDNESESEKYLQNLASKLKTKTPTTYKLFVGEDPFKKIKSYAQSSHQNNLLVVQKGSRTLSDQLFRKFLINQLVHDGSMPLVVIPL